MQSNELPLVSLLLSLFDTSQLRRFVRAQYGSKFGRILRMKASKIAQFEGVAQELFDNDYVNHELFDALLKKRPKFEERIERVRHELLPPETAMSGGAPDETGRGAEPLPTPDPDAGLSDERRAWRQRIRKSFKAITAKIPVEPDAWIQAAAVLPHFNPATLMPVNKTPDAMQDGVVKLAAFCDFRSDGRWNLGLETRRDALAELWNTDQLDAALDANPKEESAHTKLLRKLEKGRKLTVAEIGGYPDLLVARDIADWFGPLSNELLDTNGLHAVIERYERIEPLRKLVGKHFRGRKNTLKRLRLHSQGQSNSAVMALWGAGGVGKSTLLGKFLLEYEAQFRPPRPWAYLDFDDPYIDPLKPERIIEQIAHQIGLLYATDPLIGDELRDTEVDFITLESAAAGDTISFELEKSGTPDVQELVEQLAERIKAIPMPPSFLLVFDTFEQVQVLGERAVDVILTLIGQMINAMPFARFIVSGRADVPQWDNRELEGLEDLDEESAAAVLKALGVSKMATRKTIVEKVGTNPLTLRLVADAIETGRLSEEDLSALVVGARTLELQGHLYTRILGHIPDAEVRRLAHPGLLVRRLTKGVIRDVLAEICDIHPDHIDQLFANLPNHVSLFEPDAAAPEEFAALRHRQDVREIMLKLMVKDPEWQHRLAEIHQRAITHYQKIDHPIGRAEELYHRLMRNDEPAELDHLWSDELAVSLGRSWGEPFPERARLWLGTRLGHLNAGTDNKKWRLSDWEVTVAREANLHLSSEDAAGALRLLESRSERSADSKLYAIEARAWRQRGDYDKALLAIENGLDAISEEDHPRRTLELYQLAAEISFVQQNFDQARSRAESAVRLAKTLDDQSASMLMLEMLVRIGRDSPTAKTIDKGTRGIEVLLSESVSELENLYVQSSEQQLRNSPEVSDNILRTLGLGSKSVLRKAAVTFGNRADQEVIDLDAYKLEKLLDHARQSKAGETSLAHLARQVGLPEGKYRTVELATNVIRYGRLGDAIAVALDHAGNDESVRADAMSMFNIKESPL